MKKLIIFLIAGLFTLTSYGQSGVAHYTGIKLGDGAGATTAYNLVSTADYTIQKVGSTYYARPGIGTGLTAYSGSLPTPVVQSAATALTTGGTIYIKAGLYDNWDSLKITHNNITIQGAGPYLTILKLKANKDLHRINTKDIGMIWLGEAENTVIRGIELDGNNANQTKPYNPPTTYGFIEGIMGAYWPDVEWKPNNVLIENCYIHDVTEFGIYLNSLDGGQIRYCNFKDNGQNNIQVSILAKNVLIEYCNTESTSANNGVSISLLGINGTASHCVMHSSANSYAGGELGQFMTGISKNNKFSDCTITGFIVGITCGNSYNSVISNCIIDSCSTNSIFSMSDSAMFITGNRIMHFANAGMELQGARKFQITNNYASSLTGFYGLLLENYSSIHSTDNLINGNSFLGIGGNGIKLDAGTTGNYILNNKLDGSGWANDLVIDATATGNMFSKNWGVYSASWLPETGTPYSYVFPTSDGLTTGQLISGSQNIEVHSSNANYIVSLPIASALTVGMKITGQVQVTAFELRVAPSQATTVYINHVTTNKEVAIPAYTYFEIWCYDATHWILNVWTEEGVQSAPVPDAV